MKQKIGFTIIEVLIVVGIIAILSAIMLPVVARARKSAHTAVEISNMHQCGIALTLYIDDNGGPNEVPSFATATDILSKLPTCDPDDVWRTDCRTSFGAPLIGSFAYVRGVQGLEESRSWRSLLANHPNPTLLASIFHASVTPTSFKGDAPDADQCALLDAQCFMPDRVMRLRLDQSVKNQVQRSSEAPGTRLFITWSSLFFLD